MMHVDQIHIDVDLVRGMIRDQFPQYRDEPIVSLHTSGTDNAIFRIGPGVAARFPLRATDPGACANRLRAEAAAMTEFAQHCPVPTPRPLGVGGPGVRYPMPWSVQTWLDGEVATYDGLADSATFAADIVALIVSLRSAETRGRCFDGQGRGGDLADHDAWVEACFTNSAGLLDVPRLRHLWARLRALPPAGPDVMSHKDLIPPNLLVRGERLIGVLDAGRFGPADLALDLVAAWHLLDRTRRNAVRQRVGAGDVEWRRGAAWAFQQAIGLVWYYERSNPGMSALGRGTLVRLLSDPDL